ncbi:hypothetical protein NGUA15_03601 [Salmonella enterica]|nr:hypothetical protein NGUA15_03601 [Salmonella enterica]
MRFQPRHTMRMKTKRHNDRIRRHHELAVRYRYRTASPLTIRFAKPRTQKANTADAPVRIQHQLNRLNVKFKVRALFPRVFHLFFRPRHIGLITAISAGDVGSAMTQRRTYAVHCGVTAAQHNHVKARSINKRLVRQRRKPYHLFGIGDEEWQRIIYPRRVFIR